MQWGLISAPPQKAQQSQPPSDEPSSYARAVSKASASVVNIYTQKATQIRRNPMYKDPYFRRYYDSSDVPGQNRLMSARGSGVIVTDTGYILTSNHLVDGVNAIVVALQDGRNAKAELKGVNQESDLAILKIDLDNLTPVSFGNVNTVRVGDVVLAIGNPFGLGQTVTQGIISATGRRGLNISKYENFIQTDAAINPGNSGGALIDSEGNLLGINTANLDETGYTGGIGFAIPVDIAIQTLNDIIEFGRVIRGWLGVKGFNLNEQIAQRFSLESKAGMLITDVDNDSPADKAGLKPGDIITRINNQQISNGNWGVQEIAESRPGDKVSIEYLRKGLLQVIEVVLASPPLA
ncbi:MAG: trypsin-like peptidase domain-containing protein [Cellvibrionaceae bacterium]|nr:trypsin-like peptidase domain-containing protein [Cellvibrionaceae bacterium]